MLMQLRTYLPTKLLLYIVEQEGHTRVLKKGLQLQSGP